MIGNGNAFEDYWGFVGAEHHDMLVPIVTRAVRAGFHVVLLRPDDTADWLVCPLTDRQFKLQHECWHPLVYDPERPAKTRPMVTSAIQRVTQRYGGVPNVAIDLHPSGYSHSPDPQGPATISGPSQAWLVHGTAGRGGLQVVPPSVIRGQAVQCWGVPNDVDQ